MDVHKTRRVYHINATLVDGQMSQGENGKMRVWKRREHMNSSVRFIENERVNNKTNQHVA
jgi:hypothetical protein